jgi:hypothetical protein
MRVSASNISALSVRVVAGRSSETGGQGVDGVDGRSIAGAMAIRRRKVDAKVVFSRPLCR